METLLVLASKRIADKVWPDEIAKWGLGFRTAKILGTPEKRLAALKSECDVYLINYENLAWLVNNWGHNNLGAVMMVCDESTKLKHTQRKRFKALRKILKSFHRRVILTGTPIPNGMHDLFGQMYVVDQGESLGPYITAYRNRFFHPTGYMGYKWELNRGAEEEIYDAIEDKIHRVNADLSKLPPLKFVDRKISLPDKAWKQYVQMEQDYVTRVEEGLVTAANAASASSKLRQMANGNVYAVDDGEDADLFDIIANEKREIVPVHDEKTAELVELLEELQGMPALISYEFTHDRLAISKAILKSSLKTEMPKNAKGEYYVPYIGGGVPDKVANQYIDWWNSGVLPVLLGHPTSVAHGLNMQEVVAAVIYYALSYNLEEYDQFYKRVWRKGQQGTVYVYRIVAEDTVDEDMIEALKDKDHTQQSLLTAMRERTKRRSGGKG